MAVTNVPQTFRIKSFSNPNVLYNVKRVERSWVCDCPDSRHRARRCKHVILLSLLGGPERVAELCEGRQP